MILAPFSHSFVLINVTVMGSSLAFVVTAVVVAHIFVELAEGQVPCRLATVKCSQARWSPKVVRSH